ncbi:MAG: alpha/beta hydrolase [Sideroxydans sp.]|nr:alpha/beta hydrolase [Sideroxydans sp.]
MPPLRFSQYGADNGRLVIYFHGAPGAPEECSVFEQPARDCGLTIVCFDRFAVSPSVSGDTYYLLLAEEIAKIANGRKVDVVGFSIGAFIALQTCRHLTNEVSSLHLISAAAPLEAGDFLEAMAGKQVFKLAKSFPALFILLSYWQGILALIFPHALFRLLFASAEGEDKALAEKREFQSGITSVLKSCFAGHVRGYARDIQAYVHPWNDTLAAISVDTHIWHGAEDNWSPRRMADYLGSTIPNCTTYKIFSGLSHYSCLYRAVPEICRQLNRKNGSLNNE